MKEQLGIYIIEDDETMIELLSDIIEEQNLGMVLGSCAGESLEPEELRKLRPDMILVDFLMPGKEGTASQEENDFCRKLSAILTRIGMAGERGSADILRLCRYLKEQNTTTAQRNIRDLCMELSKHPKSMEQRMRRAIQTGMNSLAHLGIEDYMNEVFTEYSSTLFSFEEVRREMDFLREKRECGGKSSVKKFIDGLMLLSENNEQLF